MNIEEINEDNIASLAQMMVELWPFTKVKEESENCQKILNDPNQSCYLATDNDQHVGFIQLSLRTDYVEGTDSSPVAYIEGVYVRSAWRSKGIARHLVDMGEKWGAQKGCTEYASDAEIVNKESIEFHNKVGFKEANRIVCFSKVITK